MWNQIFILVLISAVVGLLGGLVYLVISYRKLYGALGEAWEAVKESHERYATLLHQKKSSEVRLGKMAENMAPFLNDWPWDPNNFRFIGNPVDGLQFANNEVIFVEIKSGKSRLTEGQREIRDLVKEGKVRFATFRVNEDGCSLKMEEE